MSTQTHTLVISNNDIIKMVEARTFKFGKARDNGENPKLVNNVKLTDLGLDLGMVGDWIEKAAGDIYSSFSKYADNIVTLGGGGGTSHIITFILSSKWPSANGTVFNNDCREYVANKVIHEFLSLSLPREAEVYEKKAMQALKDAERKLYYKKA